MFQKRDFVFGDRLRLLRRGADQAEGFRADAVVDVMQTATNHFRPRDVVRLQDLEQPRRLGQRNDGRQRVERVFQEDFLQRRIHRRPVRLERTTVAAATAATATTAGSGGGWAARALAAAAPWGFELVLFLLLALALVPFDNITFVGTKNMRKEMKIRNYFFVTRCHDNGRI